MSGVMNIDGCGGEDEIMSNTYVPSGVRVHPRCRRQNTRREMSVSYYKGHFLGNNSVIDVLRHEGYEVEHTPAGQTLHRRSEELLDVDAPLEPFLHESRGLQEDEDSNPRLLELLEKVEHKLKKKQRHRQFNELWVRMEESVTAQAPPPVVRIINGYSTVQTHPQEHGRANQHRTFSGSSSSCWSPALTATALCVQILLL